MELRDVFICIPFGISLLITASKLKDLPSEGMTGDRIHPLIDVSSFRHFSFPVTFFHPFPLDSSLINLRRHPRNDSVIHFFIHFLFIHLWSNVFHRGLQECKWKEMAKETRDGTQVEEESWASNLLSGCYLHDSTV